MAGGCSISTGNYEQIFAHPILAIYLAHTCECASGTSGSIGWRDISRHISIGCSFNLEVSINFYSEKHVTTIGNVVMEVLVMVVWMMMVGEHTSHTKWSWKTSWMCDCILSMEKTAISVLEIVRYVLDWCGLPLAPSVDDCTFFESESLTRVTLSWYYHLSVSPMEYLGDMTSRTTFWYMAHGKFQKIYIYGPWWARGGCSGGEAHRNCLLEIFVGMKRVVKLI